RKKLKPEEKNQKETIKKHIQQFQTGDFMTNAESLFTTLGYASNRRTKIDRDYLRNKGLNQDKALFSDWLEAGLLYQVTGEDLSEQGSFFQNQFEAQRIQSYLFYAIELADKEYPRGTLAQITRTVNKLFPMPVFILFKYGNRLTFSIIDRRQHKRDESKDVLEKVTLIKDISIANPHRAHIEILYDLSYQELLTKFRFSNFEGLHKAWQKTLDTKELNKKFYRELSAWYFYAKSQVIFADDVEKDADKRNSINLIRLITRLIFVWFVKEKGLVSEELFDEDFLKSILNYSDKTGSTYYKAILQNLFFATLNLEMNKDKPDSRKFVEREDGFHSDQHLQPAYRYARFFKEPDKALILFENIPFLNGGLFENLDFETEENGKRVIKRIDCFSDHPQNETRLKVPDELFFSDLQKVDLSAVYEDKKKRSEEFRGIINIFKRYKFTIEENTPIEEEIALDPELLGKVFENLLASYNPETHTTARKATGSFYTPREIVNYMVDESLVAYLESQLKEQIPELKEMSDLGGLIRDTLSYTEKEHPFTKAEEVDALINAIDNCKILDPACGSGAFPMGILHKLVYLLHKLDPQNEKWMNRQIERVKNAIREAEKAEDTAIREHLIQDLEKNIESIEDAFLNNELDYGRKLYLIENCIYGVDIQPIAIQIAKLRFFISIVIDQKIDPVKPNLNIRALPNLETKFVAANTLIGLEKPAQVSLRNCEIDRLENELKEVRKNHFSARSRKEKNRLRHLDEKLRNQIATLLVADGWYDKSARQLANWNPYDQNTSATFFDPEWMFGIIEGFDIVIGNPPYINIKRGIEEIQFYQEKYKSARGQFDLFSLFIEQGLSQSNNVLTYIVPKPFINNENYQTIREIVLEHSLNNVVIGSNVFESAGVESCVFVLSRKIRAGTTRILSFEDSEFSYKNVIEQNVYAILPFRMINTELTSRDVSIYRKIVSASTCLEELFEITRGVECGKDDNKVIQQKNNYPLLRGEDVEPYCATHKGYYILFDRNNEQKFKPLNLYTAEKVLIRRVANNLIATFDKCGHIVLNTIYCCLPKMKVCFAEFLTALLNSTLLRYWFKKTFILTDRLFPYIRKSQLGFIPIPVVALENRIVQTPIINLVDLILAAKSADSQVDTTALEREIDRLVYQLYGLTEEEIAVVKGKSLNCD
ncbi:MAG: Eco57I restriction-modification methylase domain-containing protein, partial [Syntrophaceae bacterium]|nr:Eco57I restriction-modification methylase domain-containing protein [Syntrophaceae bacterium]